MKRIIFNCNLGTALAGVSTNDTVSRCIRLRGVWRVYVV